MIELECPFCDKSYKFKDEALSKSFECSCGKKFIIEPPLELEDSPEKKKTSNKKQDDDNQGNSEPNPAESMIPVACPFCKKNYKFKSAALSKNYVCECGEKFIIEPTIDSSENEKETPRQKKDVVYLKGEAAKAGVNLGDKKVCSKCKAIIPSTAVKCPQCDYNTLNVKYDQKKREELSFEGISVVIKYGKYIFPVVLVLLFLLLVRVQNGKIDQTKELIQLAEAQLERERLSPDQRFKITIFRPYSKNLYFTADHKNKAFDLFALGSGWLTLKNPGVRFEVSYSNKPRGDIRHYMWNEDQTDVILVTEKHYAINDYNPIGILLR